MESILHPLVLINISDHLTRETACAAIGHHGVFKSPDDIFVVGALLGTLEGRQLSLVNSFEIALVSSITDSQQQQQPHQPILGNWNFFQQRLGQYHEVFPTLELMGWYIAGSQDLLPMIYQFLEESSNYCDSPYIVTIKNNESTCQSPFIPVQNQKCLESLPYATKASIVSKTKKCPGISVQLFDKISCLSQDLPSLKEIPYKLESGEAERICLSHIMSKSIRSSTVLNQAINSLMDAPGVNPRIRSTAEIIGSTPLATHLDSWNDAAEELKTKIDDAIHFLMAQLKSGTNEGIDVVNELLTICHAIERERNLEGNKDDELDSSITSQLALAECSILTASTAFSFQRLIELKSQIASLNTSVVSQAASSSYHTPWIGMGIESLVMDDVDTTKFEDMP